MFVHSFCQLCSFVRCRSAGSIESIATPQAAMIHRPVEPRRIPAQNCQTKYRKTNIRIVINSMCVNKHGLFNRRIPFALLLRFGLQNLLLFKRRGKKSARVICCHFKYDLTLNAIHRQFQMI